MIRLQRCDLMSRSSIKEIDDKEKKRLDELEDKIIRLRKQPSMVEVFDDELIPKILRKKPRMILNCVDEPNLPINCILYPRVFALVHKDCDLTFNPQLLKPYLERDQVLPILDAPLKDYKQEFCELIEQYPYVNSYEFHFLRFYKTTDYDGIGGMCDDCFETKKRLDFKRPIFYLQKRKRI